MSAKTLQFWLTQADHSRPVMQPLGTHGRQVATGSSAGQPVSVKDQRRQRRPKVSAHRRRLSKRYDGAVPWSGMTTHTTGTGSAPGFEANGDHDAVELCGLNFLPRKSVTPRRSGRTVVCWFELVTGNTGQDGGAIVDLSHIQLGRPQRRLYVAKSHSCPWNTSIVSTGHWQETSPFRLTVACLHRISIAWAAAYHQCRLELDSVVHDSVAPSGLGVHCHAATIPEV